MENILGDINIATSNNEGGGSFYLLKSNFLIISNFTVNLTKSSSFGGFGSFSNSNYIQIYLIQIKEILGESNFSRNAFFISKGNFFFMNSSLFKKFHTKTPDSFLMALNYNFVSLINCSFENILKNSFSKSIKYNKILFKFINIINIESKDRQIFFLVKYNYLKIVKLLHKNTSNSFIGFAFIKH